MDGDDSAHVLPGHNGESILNVGDVDNGEKNENYQVNADDDEDGKERRKEGVLKTISFEFFC